MAYLVKPVHFVKAKNKNLDSLQAEEVRSHDREVQRNQENAGREAREFYESVLAPPSQKRASNNATEDRDSFQQKANVGNKQLNCGSSTARSSDSVSVKTFKSTRSMHKLRSNVNRLLRLSQEGSLREIKRIVKDGDTDLGYADQFGWNALMCAAYSGHVHVVKFLAKKYPAGLKHRNKQGQTAVELAQKAGQGDIVKVLQQMEREESCSSYQTRNMDGHSGILQPAWCEKCESEFKDDVRIHQHSTAHLFSCGHGPQPTHYHLPESNRGFQMMLQDGWDKEKGLGKGGEGHKFPVKTILKRDREGLGSAESDVKPRITHFKPFDTDAVKRPKKEKKKERTKDISVKDTKRTRYSKSDRHKAMEIDFRMSFHSQP